MKTRRTAAPWRLETQRMENCCHWATVRLLTRVFPPIARQFFSQLCRTQAGKNNVSKMEDTLHPSSSDDENEN